MSSDQDSQLSRRSFPFIQRLDVQYDPERVLHELSVIEKLNQGWNDMKHGSALVSELTAGRERLTQAFQDEDGDYHSYEQIICTEFAGPAPNVEVIDEKFSRYRADMQRAHTGLNEAAYNKMRFFMDKAPYTTELLNSLSDPISRARFAKVKPNFKIKPHIDYDTRYGMRYHMALTTNKDCAIGFRRNKNSDFEVHHIPVDGYLYFVNAGFEHYAENMGDTERVHLVIGTVGQTLMKDHIIG